MHYLRKNLSQIQSTFFINLGDLYIDLVADLICSVDLLCSNTLSTHVFHVEESRLKFTERDEYTIVFDTCDCSFNSNTNLWSDSNIEDDSFCFVDHLLITTGDETCSIVFKVNLHSCFCDNLINSFASFPDNAFHFF